MKLYKSKVILALIIFKFFVIWFVIHLNRMPLTAYEAYRMLGHSILQSDSPIELSVIEVESVDGRYIIKIRLKNTTKYHDNHFVQGGGFLEKWENDRWELVDFTEALGDWTFGSPLSRPRLDVWHDDINIDSSDNIIPPNSYRDIHIDLYFFHGKLSTGKYRFSTVILKYNLNFHFAAPSWLIYSDFEIQ